LHDGPERFEQVQDEAVAVSDVGMDDAESGVESDGADGKSGFGFGEGVVEESVDGGRRRLVVTVRIGVAGWPGC
jgi:hypothetical protein